MTDKVQATTRTVQRRKQEREEGTAMVDRAAELAGEAQEVIRQAGDIASEYYEQGQKAVAHMENTLEQSIRDRPLQSILIAAGVGMLMGLLWRK
jgi:ElaB/YqjD/DUF883 family membrane-anchored ribosome-binding protein